MDIKDIFKKHLAWLKDEDGGERADLSGANLRWADLRGANLREADLREADLRGANLRWADLREADLREADLREADLRGANLRGADLREADLREADLDMSSGIPFHCGGTKFKGDDRLFAQMLFHLTRGDWSQCSGGVKEALEHIMLCAAVDLFCEYRGDVKPMV